MGLLEMRPCLSLWVICEAEAWNEAALGSVPFNFALRSAVLCPLMPPTHRTSSHKHVKCSRQVRSDEQLSIFASTRCPKYCCVSGKVRLASSV